MKRTYVLQENGQVTLPHEWREKHGLKKGDVITFEETEQGLLVSPKAAHVMKMLDDIGDGLKAKGITLEELIERGRDIRGKMLKERYDIEASDDD